ncbi:hypothetical protein JCM31598_25340 [Desulfonatronum parangueonense]
MVDNCICGVFVFGSQLASHLDSDELDLAVDQESSEVSELYMTEVLDLVFGLDLLLELMFRFVLVSESESAPR